MVNKAWRKTTRAFAKRLFIDGTIVRVCPCNTDPHNFWDTIFFTEIDPYITGSFEKQCNDVKCRFCNSERGETLSYYYNVETM